MNFEQILYEKDGPILTITLNRPDKLNAFTGQMMQEIIEAMTPQTLMMRCERLSLRVQEGFCAVLTSRQAKIRLTTMPQEAKRLQRWRRIADVALI